MSERRYGSAIAQNIYDDDAVEWGPSDDQIAEVPEWSTEQHRPPFRLVSARAELA